MIGDREARDMPDDGSNVGHIEPQDAYGALVEALEEGARETVGDSNDNGNGEQAPTAEREVDRMLREWRAEADAHPRLAHTLGDSVAVLGHFARAFGRETSKTVLANVARAWRGDREGRSRWVQAPRQARSVALPEREPGMTRPLAAGLLVALRSAMPAAADHCPPGQFYGVRLNQCVGLNTRLASAYVHAAASRLATPGSGDKAALPVEPEANPVGEPKIVIPFVLPTLNDWPPPK
jgi:hypothetical protein